ncbi:hypothetical protein [Paenibacillus sp.]|uniref:hypothetical protein n=1 Tax=Paenibacillus sp. TaxID=58172 RepID=UPI0028123C44|nr:hypothetical protein [Paenibacillus sp.]
MSDMEKQQAYEKLGLTAGATRDEVEKRYEILMRREKQKEIRGETSDFEQINRAYKLILEWEHREAVGAIQEKQYGKYKKYASQAERVDHFFSYYKWHLIGGIAAIALVIYGIFAYVEHREEQARLAALPPAELEASFLGLFQLPTADDSEEALEAAIVEQMPGWQRVEADVLTFNMAEQGMTDAAMLQKVVVMLATESPDIYVMDGASFEWIARNGVLLPLDAEVEGRLKDILPEGAAKKAAEAETDPNNPSGVLLGEEHVYGIDLGGTAFAESLPLAMQDMIVGIRLDSENADNALAMIERALQSAKGN